MAEFVVKDATTCRDDMCRTMKNGLIARNVPNPNVGPGSEQYVLFTAVGNELAVIGANSIVKGDAQMPDTAQGADMERIADLFKRKKQPAAGSVGAVTIACSSTTTVPTGAELVDGRGLLYEVSVGGDYSNDERVPVHAKSVGAATNHAEGDVLQWQSAPPYTNAKALVASGGLVNGADAEDVEDLRAAVISIFQNPPGTANWQQCIDIAEKSDPRVQKAFCYPAAMGPSTIRVVVAAAPTLTSKERDLEATIVSGIVEPTVLGKIIGDKTHIGVTTVANVDADVAFALALPEAPTANPPGPGGGWKNGTPWPRPNGSTTFRCTVTAITSSSQFTVDAEGPPTVGVSRIAWLSPVDWRLYTALVTSSSGSSGAYVITVDQPFTGIMVGAYIWPDSVSAKLYCESVLAQFSVMGPGELTTNPSVLVRGFRHPVPANDWPSALAAHLPNVLTKGHEEVLQAQFLHRAATGHVSVAGAAGQLVPNVPVAASDPPLQFIPRHIAFYRIG